MIPDYGVGIAMLYLLFICTTAALPIGMMAGILAAGFMRESARLGLALGLLSGFLGMAFSALMVWLSIKVDLNINMTDSLFLFMLVAPGGIALLLPIAVLWFKSIQRPSQSPES